MEKLRLFKNRIGTLLMKTLSFTVLLLLFAMGTGLFLRSQALLADKPISDLLFSSAWRPSAGEYGYLTFIFGTLMVTLYALLIAVPFSICAAVYLSEYAKKRTRDFFKSVIDILASIPSVIFGLWGVLIIVPMVKEIGSVLFGASSTGYSLLSAALVLAVMILPFIIHIVLEVLQTISVSLREAALAMGATSWQAIKHVVLRKALPGIIAACGLGLARAFGETMAVMMVAGNIAQISISPFEPTYTLPALIANNYGEMFSIPLYDSALMFAAFILFAIILLFNIISWIVFYRVKRRL
ncbi:MAG: phosphate ABC transporter permease subunit PstC [Spirochaetales bacterium]|nr:phosphate ABC transporter permease subunit PstC [Spirochaetales bacterium]